MSFSRSPDQRTHTWLKSQQGDLRSSPCSEVSTGQWPCDLSLDDSFDEWQESPKAARAPGASLLRAPTFFSRLFQNFKKVLLLVPDNAESSACLYHSERHALEVKNILTFRKGSATNRISVIAVQQQEPQPVFCKHVLTIARHSNKESDLCVCSLVFYLSTMTLSLLSLQTLPFKHM